MRRPQPRLKVRQLVAIPEDLRQSLREAFELIQEAERDPDCDINYGDAIQTPNLCGGRTGTGKRSFEFTYYANEDGSKSRWYLALHPLEIEDIADGLMKEIALYCCASPGCGHKSTDPDDRCDCDYVDDPHYGNIAFAAAEATLKQLGITGISAECTSDEVIAILGEPAESGGGMKDSILGYIHPWIKYHRPDCQLRFEFKKGKGIRLISVLDPDWQPGT